MTDTPTIPEFPFGGSRVAKDLWLRDLRRFVLELYATKSYVDSNALPEGAEGDILYHNGTDWVKLPIGPNTAVLTVVGGVPTWA